MKNTLVSGSVIAEDKSKMLEKQVEELTKLVENLMATSKKKETVSKRTYNKSDGYGEIAPNEYIKVMSLVGDKLNLSTKSRGLGKNFGFEKFGETKQIFFSDLLEINENHKNFLEAGYYCILDERVVRVLGLESLYEKILKKEQIELILEGTSQTVPLFESCNIKQKNVIINFIVEKIISGEKMDYNLVSDLSRISDIDIMERVKNIQESNDNIKK